jgi:hypothetical protein
LGDWGQEGHEFKANLYSGTLCPNKEEGEENKSKKIIN